MLSKQKKIKSSSWKKKQPSQVLKDRLQKKTGLSGKKLQTDVTLVSEDTDEEQSYEGDDEDENEGDDEDGDEDEDEDGD